MSDEERIGDGLVRIGAMTEDQRKEVLKMQKEEGDVRLFGEIAVENGFINDQAILDYLNSKH